jgi:hypothetical protein
MGDRQRPGKVAIGREIGSQHTQDETFSFLNDADLLASVRANRAERERLQARPYPVGLYVIVLERIDHDSPLTLHMAGEVTAYYPNVGDGELFVRDAWGDIERVRLHGHDDEAEFADTIGPATFFESWTAFEVALKRQYEFEHKQVKGSKR